MDGWWVWGIAMGSAAVCDGYFLARGSKPALRSASSAADDLVLVFGVVVAPGTDVVGVVALAVGVVSVVGVPGVAPGVVGAVVPPRPVPGVVGVVGVVVVGIAPGVVGVVAVIVVVTAGSVLVVPGPLLSLTSAAASTPSASVAITAIATIGAFQLVGAASRVRAAAPQLRHHSCWGSSAAPHRGQAASTGGAVLAPGIVVVGGAAMLLKSSVRVDGRSRWAGPRSKI
jgi:hypothetical protein